MTLANKAGNKIEVTTDITAILSGELTGTGGGFTKSGDGTLILSSTSNDYTGGTTVIGGTLSIAQSSNLGTPDSDSGKKNELARSSKESLATLQLTGSNGVTYTNNWTLTGSNNVIANANDVTLSGKLSGAGGFTKTGGGTLILTGDNDYGGITRIYEGTLSIEEESQRLGVLDSDAANLLSGGTLKITGDEDDYSQNWELAAFSEEEKGKTNTIHVESGQEATFATAALLGDGGFTKDGGGTLILEDENTYEGDTTIDSGTLKITGSLGRKDGEAVYTYAGNITNAGELVFARNGVQTQILSGEISGAGNLTLEAGQLYLTGNTPATLDGKFSASDNTTLGLKAGNLSALKTHGNIALGTDSGIALDILGYSAPDTSEIESVDLYIDI